jgi:hypothetical protein
MSWVEWLVLVLGLGLGYGVVSMLMGEKKRKPTDDRNDELPR